MYPQLKISCSVPKSLSLFWHTPIYSAAAKNTKSFSTDVQLPIKVCLKNDPFPNQLKFKNINVFSRNSCLRWQPHSREATDRVLKEPTKMVSFCLFKTVAENTKKKKNLQHHIDCLSDAQLMFLKLPIVAIQYMTNCHERYEYPHYLCVLNFLTSNAGLTSSKPCNNTK